MEPISSEEVDRYRALFPATLEWVYLNHAGVCAPSVRVRSAAVEWFDDVTANGLTDEEGWESRAEEVRARFARLIGASPSEVAFVRNTSHGLGLIAEGIDWRPGDRVAVCLDEEYPSNIYPWRHLAGRGVEVVTIPASGGGVDAARVSRVLDSARPRLFAVSSAQYASGAVADLAGLGAACRERDVLFCVDAIQTLGALPLDVKAAGIHFLSADSHKWLLGVSGIGGMFVDAAVLSAIRPVLVGWKSTTGAWDFDQARFELQEDALKFEEGSPAYAMIYGFGAALELLLEVGVDRIAARIRGLVDRLGNGLEALGCEVGPPPGVRAHILTFVPPDGDAAGLHAALAAERIVVSLRRGRIRVSPHFITTEAEIDRVIARVTAQIGRDRLV